jgi:hypothetical protein
MNDPEFLTDALDEDPKYAEIIKDVERKVEQRLKAQKVEKEIGYCHDFWSLKKEILKIEYGLEWKSPAEINPDIYFD